jgi:hypothetical protein
MISEQVVEHWRETRAHFLEFAAELESGERAHFKFEGPERINVSEAEAADFRRRAEYLSNLIAAHEREMPKEL